MKDTFDRPRRTIHKGEERVCLDGPMAGSKVTCTEPGQVVVQHVKDGAWLHIYRCAPGGLKHDNSRHINLMVA